MEALLARKFTISFESGGVKTECNIALSNLRDPRFPEMVDMLQEQHERALALASEEIRERKPNSDYPCVTMTSEFYCYECHDRPLPHQDGTRVYRIHDRRDSEGPYAQFLIIGADGKSAVVSALQILKRKTGFMVDLMPIEIRERIAFQMSIVPLPPPVNSNG